MSETQDIKCDKYIGKLRCTNTARISMTIWSDDGNGRQIDFCNKHLGDAVKIIIELEKLTHE